MRDKVDFQAVKRAAQGNVLSIVHWLGLEGRATGGEFKFLNPKRSDKRLGSCSINLRNGLWADFAINGASGDIIDLVAYVTECPKVEAARKLAHFLRIRGAA